MAFKIRGALKSTAQFLSPALPFTAGLAGLPAGVAGIFGGINIGEAIDKRINPISTALTGAIEPPLTEEQLKDRRERRTRQEMINLAQDNPGKRQTALTDATSQSAFPFRLY